MLEHNDYFFLKKKKKVAPFIWETLELPRKNNQTSKSRNTSPIKISPTNYQNTHQPALTSSLFASPFAISGTY
jgi:hypothetical protein